MKLLPSIKMKKGRVVAGVQGGSQKPVFSYSHAATMLISPVTSKL